MNDMLPEEQDPQFEELITLLRQADLNPPLIDPTEHAQILSQARARLFPTDSEVSQPKRTAAARTCRNWVPFRAPARPSTSRQSSIVVGALRVCPVR